jgi:hypothetical protein
LPQRARKIPCLIGRIEIGSVLLRSLSDDGFQRYQQQPVDNAVDIVSGPVTGLAPGHRHNAGHIAFIEK